MLKLKPGTIMGLQPALTLLCYILANNMAQIRTLSLAVYFGRNWEEPLIDSHDFSLFIALIALVGRKRHGKWGEVYELNGY